MAFFKFETFFNELTTGYAAFERGFFNSVFAAPSFPLIVNAEINGTPGDDNPLNGTEEDDIIDGLAGNDVINGLGGNDTLIGGEGDDTLNGGDGDDILFAISGFDRLNGGAGNDVIHAGIGRNIIDGGSGNDLFIIANTVNFSSNFGGGSGFDTLQLSFDGAINLSARGASFGGLDAIVFADVDGQTGPIETTLSLNVSNIGRSFNGTITGNNGDVDNIVILYNQSPDTSTNVSDWTFVDWEAQDTFTLQGDNAGRTFIGPDVAGTYNAGGGNDTVIAGLGDDVLIGGTGSDTLDGGNGIDTAVYSGALANYRIVTSNDGAFFVFDNVGTDGGDRLTNIELLEFSDGTVDINTVAQVITPINGTAGDDNPLNGTAGDDIINGLDGNDVINGLDGGDVIDGGAGNDILDGGAGTDLVNGGTGNDIISGRDGNDILNGGVGNDVLEGGAGADALDGGDGNDTLSYASSDARVVIHLGRQEAAEGHAEGDSITGFENATGSAFNDSLSGSGVANILIGGEGDDFLNSGRGLDTLIGGAGDDILNSSSGNANIGVFAGDRADFIVGVAANGQIRVADIRAGGTEGVDTLTNIVNLEFDDLTLAVADEVETTLILGTNSDDVFTAQEESVEILGFDGNDIITGNALSNIITGGAGDDTLEGGAGDDTLNGGASNDTLIGDTGNDTIFGNEGDDLIIWNNGDGSDVNDGGAGADVQQINLADSAGDEITISDNAGTTTFSRTNLGLFTLDLTNIELLEINGNGGDDIIDGSAAQISLQLSGGAGNDMLTGGAAANDTAIYSGGFTDYDVVDNLDGTYTITDEVGSDGVDILTGIESLTFSNQTLDIDTAVALNDAITGTEGDDDPLNGTSGDDFVFGLEGNDNIFGLEGNDTLDGGEGADTLVGGTGNDTIFGEVGNDLIIWNNGDGSDVNDGGAGADVQQVNLADGAGDEITISDDAGTTTFARTNLGLFTLDLTNIETLEINGNGGDDIIDGSAAQIALQITGGAGNDIITGGQGFDTAIYSGLFADYDIVDNPDGTFTVTDNVGSDGIDILNGIERIQFSDVLIDPDAVNLTQDDDAFDGTSEDDTINGLGGNDTINGLAGDDVIDGGNGNDVISGGLGDDRLIGGAGEDTLDFSSFTSVDGTTGIVFRDLNDGGTISAQETGEGLDTISGFDVVIGSAFNDEIEMRGSSSGSNDIDAVFAGDGDDIVIETFILTNDFADGGDGVDTFIYQESFAGFIFDMASGVATDQNGSFGSSFINFENAIGADVADESDTIRGTEGVNEISGRAGNDTIEGRGGADILDGGENIDTLSYAGSALAVTVNLETGAVSGGDAAGDVISNFENVTGSELNDVLTGDVGNNVLNGGLGNDRLDGGAGDDQLLGGEGSDTLFGGAGADVMNGGDGFDAVDYRGASSRVAFDATSGGTVGDALGDTYNSIERYFGSNFNDTITGTDANEFFFGEDGNDVINGGGGIDRIEGGAGNDVMRGGDGNDVLFGGEGADQLNGGTGFDIANYTGATSRISVNLTSGGVLGDAAGDTYFGIEAVFGSDFDDIMIGSSGSNELRGFDGDDILNGAAGSDRLMGGNGADTLNGGTGTDIALYTTATDGVTLDLVTGGTGGEAAGDTFSSIEFVFGSDFADNITGDAAGNRLLGNDGNDILNGAGGNDRLLGGNGNDIINGGDGVDTIFGQDGDDLMFGGAGNDFFFGDSGADSHNGGDGIDTVSYLASSTGIGLNMQSGGFNGDAAGDSYVSIERIFGSGHDDFIFGSDGDDILFGNGGDDTLAGGAGNDSLNGGAGVDSFQYDSVNGDADVIQGFTTNEVIEVIFDDPAFDSFAEIMAVAIDAGANTLIDFGSGNTLTITGLNIADLGADNFTFTDIATAAEPLGEDVFGTEVMDVFGMDALI